MKLMSPTDTFFLLAESREHPLHVAGLQLFTAPPGAGPEFVRETYNAMLACADIQPAFRKRPATTAGLVPNVVWSVDDDIDMEYHVRRSALPAPGRVRELLELTSRLHGSLLDRHRPLWESHVIEGLGDGRFAIYTKMHHALVDGVSALRLLQGSLSSDPADTEIRAPWALPSVHRLPQKSYALQRITGAAGSVAKYVPSTLGLARAAIIEQQLTLPYRAPRTILNVSIGGARRCAAQSWSLERIKAVKNAAGVSINDIVLAMCSGALRSYLGEHNSLPDTPLIAMVPVSLRNESDPDGGNVVSGVLCSLGTNLDDPARRLAAIHQSMRANKEVLTQLPRAQAMALAAAGLLGPAAIGGLPGLRSAPPPFNVCVSNVPGVREPLYLNGARLEANYPMSIALDGQALNFTLATSADSLDFGLVGCRRAVPHLQRLLGHLEDALSELECVVGI